MLVTSAARAGSVDCGEMYERNRQGFIAILRTATTEQLALRVEATPAWSVRDVLSHVVGVTADMNAQNFGRVDADEWTGRQVQSRRDQSLATVVDEWDREATTFEDGLRLFGYELGSHYVGDLFTHTQDVRSTLGLPRGLDAETVVVALDFYLGSLDDALREGQLGGLEIIANDEHHLVGTSEPAATLRADPFDALRSLSGRRSLAQIRALDWTGDVERMAPQLSRYPLPEHDLLT